MIKELSSLASVALQEELRQTEITQPALYAHSMAVWSVVRAELGFTNGLIGPLVPHAMLGHSVGEFSAIAAGGGGGIPAIAQMLRLRGRAMQHAGEALTSGSSHAGISMIALMADPRRLRAETERAPVPRLDASDERTDQDGPFAEAVEACC